MAWHHAMEFIHMTSGREPHLRMNIRAGGCAIYSSRVKCPSSNCEIEGLRGCGRPVAPQWRQKMQCNFPTFRPWLDLYHPKYVSTADPNPWYMIDVHVLSRKKGGNVHISHSLTHSLTNTPTLSLVRTSGKFEYFSALVIAL